MESRRFITRIVDDYGNLNSEEAVIRLMQTIDGKIISWFYWSEMPEDRFCRLHYLKGYIK